MTFVPIVVAFIGVCMASVHGGLPLWVSLVAFGVTIGLRLAAWLDE